MRGTNYLLAPAAFAVAMAFSWSVAAQTAPPMGGGYADVISIPVSDPATKAIAGALFKPTGSGPFPAVIYMGGCGGIDAPPFRSMQKSLTDHFLSKGVAFLIVDSFTPRNEAQGICPAMANLNDKSDAQLQYVARGGNDALAALNVLTAMPDIDKNHVFLLAYSYGAIAELSAINKNNPANHAKVAGVIAYYPFCYANADPSTPVLVLVGEKDDWTPAATCQAVTGKTDFQVVVYPGATHAFSMNFGAPVDALGHHMVYDEQATRDAQQRADAFIVSHSK